MKIRTAAVVAAISATAAALTACGDDAARKGDGVAVTATDTTCAVASTSLPAGKVTFAVTNKGERTTEVYVYGRQGDAFTKVVAEVENVAPGLSRDLTATLAGGTYEIACKPGQTGDGIRTRITVSAASTAASAEAEAAYDREIEVEVTTAGIEGADGLTAATGEKVEFKLENRTPAARSLEILDPSGKMVAGIQADPNGGGAETIVPLTSAGAWTLKIEGAGVAPVSRPLTVG